MYLWNGNQEKCIFAWVGWKKIATPKKWGGWGLKDLPSFAQALAAKMGWTLLTGNNLWSSISYHKYIWPHNILDWVRLPTWLKTGISSVWKALLNSLPLIRDNLLEYINALSESHIRIKQGPDEIIWYHSGNGIYTPKSGYLTLISHKIPDTISFWWQTVWKLTAPPRQKLFFWCILQGVVPTGDYLMHRTVYGPTWCTFCKQSSESCTHLFLFCPAISVIWQAISIAIHHTGKWEGHDINRAWESWFYNHKHSKLQSFPIITCWYIWLARNRFIFDDKPAIWLHIISLITVAYNTLPDPPQPRNRSLRDPPHIDHSTPWAFFDGSAQQQGCGGGFLLFKNDQHFYKVKLGLGPGTNNFAEIISLRHLLHFALGHNCMHIHIFGDSKIIIDWFNNIAECHTHTLRNILDDIIY
eukprot:PITA_23686